MTNEQRKEQEELAALQFSAEEIQTITGLPTDEMAYKRGRLLAQAEVRKSILQLAKQGSTPAQKQFLEMSEQSSKAKTPPKNGLKLNPTKKRK